MTAGGSSEQVKNAQFETSEVVTPADAADVDAKMLHADTAILNTEHEIRIESGAGPGAQGEQGQQGQQKNALRLVQRKYAPIKQFSSEQAEELLSQLTTSEMRTRIIARAVEDISLADEGFANRMQQHSSGWRVTDALLNEIAWSLIQQYRDRGHALNGTKKAVFNKMTEKVSADLQALTCEAHLTMTSIYGVFKERIENGKAFSNCSNFGFGFWSSF